MADPNVNVRVESPPRLGSEIEAVEFAAQTMRLSYAWGAQPARAELEFIGTAPVPVGAAITLTLPNHVFYGIAEDCTIASDSGGTKGTLRFVDSRYFLWSDPVFCVFNQMSWRMVAGARRRQFWHIYPADIETMTRTWTDAPLSALQVLQAIFTAPTVETAWSLVGHADLALPALSIDARNGRPLGDVAAEVSRRVGLDFTLAGGRYRLVWGRPGEGSAPVLPAAYKRASLGEGLSGAPTRVSVVGDRNLYQILDVQVWPDWSPGWQEFYEESLLTNFVYRTFTDPDTGDPFKQGDANRAGVFAAQAYASRLTVGQFIDLAVAAGYLDATTRANYDDYRYYAGRCRMEMPVVLYLRQILFRAFRPNLILVNADGKSLPLRALQLVPVNLVGLTHDPATGLMTADPAGAIDSNGFAVARGYQLFERGFADVRPDRVRLDDWADKQSRLYQRVSFTIDDGGQDDAQFILFDQPLIDMAPLLTTVDGLLVLNSAATVTGPVEVRAALTFAAERFRYVAGSGYRDAVEYVAGLTAEFVVAGDTTTELPFGDGQTASQKAAAVAVALLQKPFTLVSGGWAFPGATGQGLTGQVDRVEITLSPADGLVERVDYALGRAPDAFLPEADLTRLRQVERLFPGGDELRRQADDFERLARVLRVSRDIGKSFYEIIYEMFDLKNPEQTWFEPGDETEATLPVGTPLWRQAFAGDQANARAALPANHTEDHVVLAGVTIREGEQVSADADDPVPCKVVTSGNCLVRAHGPVAVGEALYRSTGNDYLVAEAGIEEGEETVPSGITARDNVTAGTTKLIQAVFGGGGGTGGDGPVWL